MTARRALIIGGGLGGLATALRLSSAGWRVTVCEQGPRFGGKMNSSCRDGFRFDTGPSLITMPWVFHELFEAAGCRLEDQLQLVRTSPICDYAFDDGVRFAYSASLPDWLPVVRDLEGSAAGFFQFMELGARLWEVSKRTFLKRRPLDFGGRSDAEVLRYLPLRHGWGDYHRTVQAHFRSPHLRQLYDRYPTYVGSSPYHGTPATLAVIPYIEYAFGGWHVTGGLYRIVEALVAILEERSVELLHDARVSRIIRDSNDRVTGVQTAGGGTIPADVVVCNADTADRGVLLDEAPRATRPSRERSMSGLIFLLGVRRDVPELTHHSVHFSQDYRREFADLFDARRFPDDPTVYVSVPSRSDRSLVPNGVGETLFVMANAPANDAPWTDADVAEARRRVFSRLSRSRFPIAEADIVVEECWTPTRLAERYGMPGGAIYGSHSHGWRKAFFRPPNRDRQVRGLYYVGGSTHPGGGTPTVLLSAKIVASLIERYER